MQDLLFELPDGVRIVIPANLSSITTHVLLEQEDWFEKELGFVRRWLKPGMVAVDIGANVGTYALAMARCVGAKGRVVAVEPGRDPARMLARSREINGFTWLTVVEVALSDAPRRGILVSDGASELGTLAASADAYGSATTESVPVDTLDRLLAELSVGSPDFIKIDAEGEEERILEGGTRTFGAGSPLLMFEVKAGTTVNERLPRRVQTLGYGLYRLLPGADVLVPVATDRPLDSFELNLFGAKPDRAALLAADGVLVSAVPDWSPSGTDLGAWRDVLRGLGAAPLLGPLLADRFPLEPRMAAALAGYARWLDPGVAMPERCGALAFAMKSVGTLLREMATLPRLCLFARAAADAGERVAAFTALAHAAQQVGQASDLVLAEPFWPPVARFDAIAPGDRPGEWLQVAILEGLEKLGSHSGAFVPSAPERFDLICRSSYAAVEVHRRRVLAALRMGARPEIPECLQRPSAGHRNADLWRNGLVARLAR